MEIDYKGLSNICLKSTVAEFLQNTSGNWSKTITQVGAELLFSHTPCSWLPLPLLSGNE